MKYFAMNKALMVVSFMFSQSIFAGGNEFVMVDPVLGLDFKPSVAQIETASIEVVEALSLRVGEYWVFADYDDSRQSGNRYMIIAGISPVMLDTEPPSAGEMEPDFGIVVIYSGNSYRALGVPDRLFSGDLKLESRIRQGLIEDAIRRLIRVFGSKAALQDAIKTQWKNNPDYQKPVLDALRRVGIAD